MHKKTLTKLLILVMVLSILIPGVIAQEPSIDLSESDRRAEEDRDFTVPKAIENPFGAVKAPKAEDFSPAWWPTTSMTVSQDVVSKTEARDVEVVVDLGYAPDLDSLEWTFGGVAFEEWKSWTSGTSYDGDPFIYFEVEPYLDGNLVKATVTFDLPYGSTNLSARARRTRMLDLIGTYYLAVEDADTNKRASAAMELNVYDSFHTYDQLKPAVKEIIANAKHGRYLEYQSLGESVEGREIPFVIMAKDQSDVNDYLEGLLPQMLEDPASLQAAIVAGTMGDYKVPIWINNIHPDETPGVDAQIDLLEIFASQEEVAFYMTDEHDAGYAVVLDVEEVLEHVILLFSLTNNPDGRANMTRGNVLGFDLNRDYGFQGQVESQAVTSHIAKWSPISFLDLHGFVTGFLIEPCTPPHEFNLEYDLYLDNAMEQAHRMGNAAVANTTGYGLDSYFIPRDNWLDGWDDGTISYAPMYAMQHGALGHTIEMPQLNQENNNAMVYAVLAAIDFTMEKKDELFHNQLEYFRRGVDGEDNRLVDELFVDPDFNPIGRPRGDYDSFFPDYYVIPVDADMQKNVLEAYRVAAHLIRNGIKVDMAAEGVTVDGVTYPAGSFVVDMRQAKRGLANAFLYDGPDFSAWGNMYAEVVAAYHHLRGFDAHTIREVDAFAGKLTEVEQVWMPETQVSCAEDYYVLQNVNNDTIKAVNALLDAGKSVEMILEAGYGYVMGDFLVSAANLAMVKDDFYLEVYPVASAAAIASEALVKPAVAAYGYQARFVMDELGFEQVDIADANVAVDDYGYANSSWMKDRIEAGLPYVGINGYAARGLADSGLLPGLARETTRFSHEGTIHADINVNSVITGRYDAKDVLFSRSGTWLTSIPETSLVLANVADHEDFYIAGWWPGYEGGQGTPFIITDNSGPARITLFTGNVTNRAHPKHQFRMLANAVFGSLLDAGISAVELDVERIAGSDRFATSAAVALEAFDEGADNVIIARGDDAGGFADGLAASFLSGVKDAPILLTRSNSLPAAAASAISDLGASHAYVLGGEGAISCRVVEELLAMGLTVKRIEGATRFETAVNIAAEGGADALEIDTAIVVSGHAPADSLVAGPIARMKGYPILLVNKDSIPAATMQAIDDFGITNIIVIGGASVVSATVYDELAAMVNVIPSPAPPASPAPLAPPASPAPPENITRIAGVDRYATSVEVASLVTSSAYSIVGGNNLVDAVGAAAFGDPILYVRTDLVPSVVQDYLDEVTHAGTRFTIFGGINAVSDAVKAELQARQIR